MLYVAAGTVCTALALKLTVLGLVVITSNVPTVCVNVPATPSIALAPSCSRVPLSVTLKRLAVPDSVELALNVAVPAVAAKLPDTARSEAREKLFVVVMLPGMLKALKAIVPAPLTV